MSFKDLFSKVGRKQRSIEKLCAKACNKLIKPDDRRPALYALLEEARVMDSAVDEVERSSSPETELKSSSSQFEAQSPNNPNNKANHLNASAALTRRHREDAILALLSRFTFTYDTNMVNDEEEKNMVFEGLVDLGDQILPQIHQHLKQSPTLSWGLRLIHTICDHETTWTALATLLEDFDPEYERDPTRKLQLMTFLGEFTDERAVTAMLPFLTDHDETVRFVTAEGLFKQGSEVAREPLLQLLTNEEEESLRIKNRIAEGFKETGWAIKGFRGMVEKVLPPEYIVDGKGHIRLKKARD